MIEFLGLTNVPVLDTICIEKSVDEWVEYAKGKSLLADIEREGIVVRPIKEKVDIELGRLSFKVINPEFLLKFKE